MQAVILSAGKGTRMGKQDIPKPLSKVLGKTLLEYKLESLPPSISEIIIIIGYRGELIREYIGSTYRDKPIRFIEDTTISGTAHALWHAKDILKNRFLVMMGDDIYDPKSLKEASLCDCSIVCKVAKREDSGSRVLLNAENELVDFITEDTYKKTHSDGGLIFTGLYSLTTEIFSYQPVKMKKTEEWGLPQTLLSAQKTMKPKIITTDFWLPISTPEDIQGAEKFIEKSPQTSMFVD